MEKYLPKHLCQPEVLGKDEAQRVERSIAEGIEAHVSPFFVRATEAMGSQFTEWRGEGKYLYDPSGAKLFDCVGGGGVFGLGFAHPVLVEVVKRQAERGGLVSRTGLVPGQAELAEKLVSLAGGDLKFVYFANSGTESVEAAIKLARLSTGRRKLIGTKLGYHGMSIATISLSDIGMWRDGIGPYLAGTEQVVHGDLDSLEAALDEDTAAVVLEPIQWASGCNVVSEDYFSKVKELCRRRGALLILDEVQTGLGRTGKPFAFQHWGVQPDILCLGKILSGGMVPIAAVVYTPEVQKAERMRALFNNSSYGGNSLACAAGIATLNLLEDRYFDRAEQLGGLLGEVFERLKVRFEPMLSGYRGLGLMRCLEFNHPVVGLLFGEWMRRDHGIVVASMSHMPQFVRVSPPFICDDEDILSIEDAAVDCLQKLQQTSPAALNEEYTSLVIRFQRAMAAYDESVEEAVL